MPAVPFGLLEEPETRKPSKVRMLLAASFLVLLVLSVVFISLYAVEKNNSDSEGSSSKHEQPNGTATPSTSLPPNETTTTVVPSNSTTTAVPTNSTTTALPFIRTTSLPTNSTTARPTPQTKTCSSPVCVVSAAGNTLIMIIEP